MLLSIRIYIRFRHLYTNCYLYVSQIIKHVFNSRDELLYSISLVAYGENGFHAY